MTLKWKGIISLIFAGVLFSNMSTYAKDLYKVGMKVLSNFDGKNWKNTLIFCLFMLFSNTTMRNLYLLLSDCKNIIHDMVLNLPLCSSQLKNRNETQNVLSFRKISAHVQKITSSTLMRSIHWVKEFVRCDFPFPNLGILI